MKLTRYKPADYSPAEQAKHLETELRDRVLTHNNDPARAQVYLALAVQVQSVAERLEDIEPKPEYRMLEVGEKILEGDQFKSVQDDNWHETRVAGSSIDPGSVGYYRRRIIQAAEFQQLSDFYEKEVQS
jgi:hypothetical protein